MRSKSVVLPAPFGPIMPTISPLPTENDTSSTARIAAERPAEPGDLERDVSAATYGRREPLGAARRRCR